MADKCYGASFSQFSGQLINTCDLLGLSFFIDLLTNDWSTGLKLKEEYPCPGVFYFIASILGGLSYLDIVNLFLFPYLYIFFYSGYHI